MPTVPLGSLVDDDQWEAEDLAGRLGIVAHAAFLCAGFMPYGDEPSSGHLLKQVDEIGPSAPVLSRRYTVAQLARHEDGAEADGAVLEVRARGDGNVAFQVYLLMRDGDQRCRCEAVLDDAALAPLVSCRVVDAAHALEAEEPADASASLWRSLVDWVLPVLFLELCRRNDLPVTDFASMHDEMKAEILKKLTDGKDLARVECASSELLRLVVECELWKSMYESLGLPPGDQSSDFDGLGSWKERYMKGRQRRRPWRGFLTSLFAEIEAFRHEGEADLQEHVFGAYSDDDDEDEDWSELQRTFGLCSRWRHPFITPPMEFRGLGYAGVFRHVLVAEPVVPSRHPEPEVVAKVKNAGRRQPQNRKAQRSNYQKKWHGAGAIHSPSSHFKWRHR